MASFWLMLATLAGAVGAGLAGPRRAGQASSFPWATMITAVVVAAMAGAQTAWPALLPAFARTPALVRHGELWRAMTALFVQDGGVPGTVFNLVILLAVGTVAESRLGARRWCIVYLGGGVATEFLALAWQPDGAGNSIACFALAGALAADPLRGGQPAVRWPAAAVSAIAATGLLVLRDIHGIGFVAGGVLRWLLDGRSRNEGSDAPR